MSNPLSTLYYPKREIFGVNWVGPDSMDHAISTLVARYPATNSDGKEVEVYCTAMPATFYELKVQGKPGAVGYTISTGSGCAKWSAKTAEHIANGMVNFKANI